MSRSESGRASVPTGDSDARGPSNVDDLGALMHTFRVNQMLLDVPVPCISTEVVLDSDVDLFEDRSAYSISIFSNFDESIHNVKINQLVEVGNTLVHALYTYRSCSKAIPQIRSDASAESREQYYRLQYQLLGNEAKLCERLYSFDEVSSAYLNHLLNEVTLLEARQRHVITDVFLESLVRFVDVLLKLNGLKDMKAGLSNDYSALKRSQTQVRHDFQGMDDRVIKIQRFLGTRNAIVDNLRSNIHKISGFETAMVQMMSFCTGCIENAKFVFPDEKHRLYRVLAFGLFVLLGRLDDKARKKIQLDRFFTPFKLLPVVPLYGDMSIDTVQLFEKEALRFGFSVRGERRELEERYDLSRKVSEFRSQFMLYSAKYKVFMHKLERCSFSERMLEDVDVLQLLRDGLVLIGRWSAAILEQSAWKYAHPISAVELAQRGFAMPSMTAPASGNGNGGSGGNDGPESLPSTMTGSMQSSVEYDRVVGGNYEQHDREALVEVIGFIKGLHTLLARDEPNVAPLIRVACFVRVQKFVQREMRDMFRKAHIRSKSTYEILLDLRGVLVKWSEGHEPADESMQGKKNPKSYRQPQIRPLKAPVLNSQFLFTRILVSSMVCERSPMKGGKELKEDHFKLLRAFLDDISWFPYLYDLSGSLRTVSDLADLWYREFYLEITKSTQFPIESSLPWILVSSALGAKNPALIENILCLLDLYNDASYRALEVLRQQFLYDEIEAEMNLVFVQLVLQLSNNIFEEAKIRAASQLLDTTFSRAVRTPKHHHPVNKSRFEALMQQRNVQILGRSVDLCQLLADQVNTLFHENVEEILNRFEQSNITCVIELKHLLDCTRSAHRHLSEFLPLDSFDSVFSEVNGSLSVSPFDGTLARLIKDQIIDDLIPAFAFKLCTNRFIPLHSVNGVDVRSLESVHRMHYYARVTDVKRPNLYFGSPTLCSCFISIHDLTRRYFGAEHLEAIIDLLGPGFMSYLAESLLARFQLSLDSVMPILQWVSSAVTSFEWSNFRSMTFVQGYRTACRALSGVIEAREQTKHIFQSFRVAGNIISLLMLIDRVRMQSHMTESAQFVESLEQLPVDLSDDRRGELFSCLKTIVQRQGGFVSDVQTPENGGSGSGGNADNGNADADEDDEEAIVPCVQLLGFANNLLTQYTNNSMDSVSSLHYTLQAIGKSIRTSCATSSAFTSVLEAEHSCVAGSSSSGASTDPYATAQASFTTAPKKCWVQENRGLHRTCSALLFLSLFEGDHLAEIYLRGDGVLMTLCALLFFHQQTRVFSVCDVVSGLFTSISSHFHVIDDSYSNSNDHDRLFRLLNVHLCRFDPDMRQLYAQSRVNDDGKTEAKRQVTELQSFLFSALYSWDVMQAGFSMLERACPPPAPERRRYAPPS